MCTRRTVCLDAVCRALPSRLRGRGFWLLHARQGRGRNGFEMEDSKNSACHPMAPGIESWFVGWGRAGTWQDDGRTMAGRRAARWNPRPAVPAVPAVHVGPLCPLCHLLRFAVSLRADIHPQCGLKSRVQCPSRQGPGAKTAARQGKVRQVLRTANLAALQSTRTASRQTSAQVHDGPEASADVGYARIACPCQPFESTGRLSPRLTTSQDEFRRARRRQFFVLQKCDFDCYYD